jgi:hypothetical protein
MAEDMGALYARITAKLDALIEWDALMRRGVTQAWSPVISIEDYKAMRAALAETQRSSHTAESNEPEQ